MTKLIQTLTQIRDDLAHDRNAWLSPQLGDAEKYQLFYDRAQAKVAAMNEAIFLIEGMTKLEAAE